VSLFITGTDTGVGKTYTVIQLLRLLRGAGRKCAGMKPICCGDRDDAHLLLAASSPGLTIDEINPLWLKTPAAPLTAALVENVAVDRAGLAAAFNSLQARVPLVLVEGVGGWLVPIAEGYFVQDLAADLGLPVLVVAQNRLGCLNHTLLTLQSIAARGLRCVGVVLNATSGEKGVANSTNAEVLRKLVGVAVLPGLIENATEITSAWAAIFEQIPGKICSSIEHKCN
jgi:dethiobiotin synthetase